MTTLQYVSTCNLCDHLLVPLLPCRLKDVIIFSVLGLDPIDNIEAFVTCLQDLQEVKGPHGLGIYCNPSGRSDKFQMFAAERLA